jgi:sec-independent protein translocase protein TatA
LFFKSITMIVSNVLATVLLFGMPGGSEWIFIILAIVLLFGGKKIPELMKGIGKGMREFKDAKDNVKSEIEEGMKEKDKEQEIRELRQQLQDAKQAQELSK